MTSSSENHNTTNRDINKSEIEKILKEKNFFDILKETSSSGDDNFLKTEINNEKDKIKKRGQNPPEFNLDLKDMRKEIINQDNDKLKIIEEYFPIKKDKEKKKDNQKCEFSVGINIIRKETDNKIETELYMNITKSNINKKDQKKESLNKDNIMENNENKENESYSLNDSSSLKCENSTISESSEEKEFNKLRSDFYIKYKLYDNTFNTGPNLFCPPKYKINEKHFGFLYKNELVTYAITKSNFINNCKNNNKEYEGYNHPKLGLYFCGKEFEIIIKENIKNTKCAPNQFMCRDCMEINKTIYNIKSKYLININGRVAKINKGSYHCFGHYLDNNQIEDCITKFTCKACKLLDEYSQYYT